MLIFVEKGYWAECTAGYKSTETNVCLMSQSNSKSGKLPGIAKARELAIGYEVRCGVSKKITQGLGTCVRMLAFA